MGERSAVGVAAVVGRRAFRRSLGRSQQLADTLDVAGSNRAGEQAVMSDAMETARQDVQEKAADELGGVERHVLSRSRPLIR